MKNWTGIDNSLDISLFEYGFICTNLEHLEKDEYFVLYKVSEELYGITHITEGFLDRLVKGFEFADRTEIIYFLSVMGQSKKEWLKLPFVAKLSDCLTYWGCESIFGMCYNPLTKAEAITLF